MKFWKSGVCAIVLVGLAGCSDPAVIAAKKAEEDSKKAVLADLKDPDSAKFGEYVMGKGKDGVPLACLTVNAKNSMGGYTGNQQAFLTKKSGKWEVRSILNTSQDVCVIIMKDTY